MNETADNYLAASPYLGGEPNTLNTPSMVEYTCFGTCTWTRTVKSTLDIDQEWTISFINPTGVTLSAEESPMPTAKKRINITVDDQTYEALERLSAKRSAA